MNEEQQHSEAPELPDRDEWHPPAPRGQHMIEEDAKDRNGPQYIQVAFREVCAHTTYSVLRAHLGPQTSGRGTSRKDHEDATARPRELIRGDRGSSATIARRSFGVSW